jgi:putative hydrolase of the HAD superfamily
MPDPARQPAVILLDALGTLVGFEPPAPRLRAELADRFGLAVSEAEAARAITAEIAYYRAHLDDGRDLAGLEDLRRRCAAVLRSALPDAACRLPLEGLVEALLASLHFSAFADVAPALAAARERGQRLVVVSNWDVSLHGVLRGLGLEQLVDGVLTSAEVGVRKPAPAIFERALALAGAGAGEAVHVGDSLDDDVAGARAAGIEAVLVRRGGGAVPPAVRRGDAGSPGVRRGDAGEPVPGVKTISSLAELADLALP